MGVNWNYALLSKMAKEAGGPELFVKGLRKAAEAAGRSQMIPFIGISVAAGTGIGFGIRSLIDYIHDKREESIEAADKAEAELIQAIKDYDKQESEKSEILQTDEQQRINQTLPEENTESENIGESEADL